MGFTPRNGGPGARVRRWSWARCWPRCRTSARRRYSSEAFTMPRRSRETSTARKPATCFPARRWPRVARFARAPASTSSWRRRRAGPPKCRAWSWAARSPTRRSTRTTRCFTARTSRGPRRRLPRRWKFIRRWPLTGCSRTPTKRVTAVCSMPFCPTRKACAGKLALTTAASSTSTSIPFVTWSSASTLPARRVNCRDGGRRCRSPTWPARRTAFRRTSPST